MIMNIIKLGDVSLGGVHLGATILISADAVADLIDACNMAASECCSTIPAEAEKEARLFAIRDELAGLAP